MMAFIKSCQSAVASFHSAIDYEQENNYEVILRINCYFYQI